VIDKNDICPEVAGKVEFNGCPDTDGDGVSDPEDACIDIAGSIEMKGCPDTDGDGISDATDSCIDEIGPLDNNGCPWPDADNDGVADKDDLCKDEVGSISNNGCPELSNEVMKTINEFGAKINFAASSDKILGKKMFDILYKIKDILIENPVGNLLIEGYASADGSEEYNIELSVKRAEAVRDFLNKIGINIERLEVRGLGVNSPVGNNESPEGRAENRRVQFIYKN
jgi:outer membrane protein OmpA-like peptidoglycan-associated protein